MTALQSASDDRFTRGPGFSTCGVRLFYSKRAAATFDTVIALHRRFATLTAWKRKLGLRL